MFAYSCRYRNSIGYACRVHGRRWLFVPELGQPDARIHRNLRIEDLLFRNPLAREMELRRDARAGVRRLCSTLLRRLHGDLPPLTVGGQLFVVY